MTILDEKCGSAEIISKLQLTGPNGSKAWERHDLDDGRVIVVGPYTFSVPKWVTAECLPAGSEWDRAGGTTDKWSAFISKSTNAAAA